jgi:addiction module HigA family antidote
MRRDLLEAVHPGEILLAEFLEPLGVTQYRLAKDTSVPPRRVNEIVKGMRAISADTALRLAKYFGTSELFWLNLQAKYDLEVEKERLGKRLESEVRELSREVVTAPGRMTKSAKNVRQTGQRRSAFVKKLT